MSVTRANAGSPSTLASLGFTGYTVQPWRKYARTARLPYFCRAFDAPMTATAGMPSLHRGGWAGGPSALGAFAIGPDDADAVAVEAQLPVRVEGVRLGLERGFDLAPADLAGGGDRAIIAEELVVFVAGQAAAAEG